MPTFEQQVRDPEVLAAWILYESENRRANDYYFNHMTDARIDSNQRQSQRQSQRALP